MNVLDTSRRRLGDPRSLVLLGVLGVVIGVLALWLRARRSSAPPDANLQMATRTTSHGDVVSDDPAGDWADDGGGGAGGSQTASLPT